MNVLKTVPAAIAMLFPLGSMAAETIQTAQASPGATVSSERPAAPTQETMLPAVKVIGKRLTETYADPVSSVATKTDTPIMQTATKVEVLTQQALRDMGVQSQGMAQAMATLGIGGLGMGDLGDLYFYRGFQATTTLWNGFRTEDMGSSASNGVNGPVWMNNVDRMEILRGASSILYGRSEPGGAINIVTKKPREEFGGSVDTGIGSRNTRWASVDLTGPLNADKSLLYRLNVGHEESDSPYTYGHDYRSDGIAPSLEYRLSPQTKLYMEGQYRNVVGGSDQPYIPINVGTNTMMDVDPADTLMPGTYSKFEQRRTMLGVDHQINDDWSLTWKYMYNDVQSPLTVVNWTTGMYYPSLTSTPSGEIEWTRWLSLNTSGQRGHASMLELLGKAETGSLKHTMLLGMDYYNTKSFQHAGSDQLASQQTYNNPPSYTYDQADFYNAAQGGIYNQFWNLNEHEVALYAQDQIQFPNDVYVLIGGRYQRQRELSKVVYPQWPDFNQDLPYKRNVFLPRFSALWQPVPTVSVYYSYTENQGASQGLEYPGTPIKPEQSKQHEIGSKFEILDGRVIASAAIFDIEKKNIASSDAMHPGYNLGVGRVRSTGYELSLQGALTNDWNVLTTYNYAHPSVKVGTDGIANSSQPQYIVAGGLLPYMSPHTFSLLTSYRLSPGWKVGGGYNWFSAATRDEASAVSTHAYGVASAFVAYETKLSGHKTTFQLNVDNLFDKQYLQYQGDFGNNLSVMQGYGYAGDNYVGGNWGTPRTIKLGMHVEF